MSDGSQYGGGGFDGPHMVGVAHLTEVMRVSWQAVETKVTSEENKPRTLSAQLCRGELDAPVHARDERRWAYVK